MTEQEKQTDAQVTQWRTRDRYSADGNDWEDWDDWEDVEPGVHDVGFGPRAEFGGSAQIEFRVKPPTIVSGVRGAGKNPVPPLAPPGVWSGTVKACGVTGQHAPHTWQSGDDGFLGGAEYSLCPGIRDGSDAPRPRGYRGPWPPKAGQTVSVEDVTALYLAAAARTGNLSKLVEEWGGGDPS